MLVPDSEVTARDLSFKSVWRELRGQGWTRKPPPRRGLDDRFFYVRPGCSWKGVEGTDYFRGEGAVLELYATILRSTARAPPSGLPTATPGAQLAAAAEVVRQNYAADIEAAESRTTGVSGSMRQRVMQSPEPPATPPRSRAPTKKPARRSIIQTPSPASTPPRQRSSSETLIATFPHVQGPTASEDDSEPYLPSPCASETGDSESVATVEASDPGKLSILLYLMVHIVLFAMQYIALHNRLNVTLHLKAYLTLSKCAEQNEADDATAESDLLADKEDDLNTFDPGDDAPHFGTIDSGDDAEKDDVEDGEYESEGEVNCAPEDIHDDPVETETEIAAEVLFADNFLESFGGVDEVLAGNLKAPVLRSMASIMVLIQAYVKVTRAQQRRLCAMAILLLRYFSSSCQ
ncbi:hypothetical protein PHMEG_00035662 [Phytophthora megakarya]|uniref:Uncharacterized protein n=1 Tax=Phytophthora megakarya TaxID=4795 RepID=A0A225UMV7_9STRA|nr:hypothetical protein PHMEG_00035662 [Phytophthora megakarya]